MQLPVEINHIKSEGVVRITWDDGHVGEYAQEYLRGYCPCALCQGHGAQRKFISVPEARLQDICAVGNYAVEFRWQDGHSTAYIPLNTCGLFVLALHVGTGEPIRRETGKFFPLLSGRECLVFLQ